MIRWLKVYMKDEHGHNHSGKEQSKDENKEDDNTSF